MGRGIPKGPGGHRLRLFVWETRKGFHHCFTAEVAELGLLCPEQKLEENQSSIERTFVENNRSLDLDELSTCVGLSLSTKVYRQQFSVTKCLCAQVLHAKILASFATI